MEGTPVREKFRSLVSKTFANVLVDANLRETVVGSSYVLKAHVLGVLFTYLFFLTISRKFGPETVGLFNIAYTFLFVLATLATSGMDSALVVFIARAIKDGSPARGAYIYRKCLGFVIAAGLIFAIMTYISAPSIVRLFQKETLCTPLRIMACMLLPYLFLNLTAHALRGLGYLRNFALFQNTNYLLLAIILVFAGQSFLPGNYLPEYAWAGAVCIAFPASLYFVAKHIRGGRSGAAFPVSYRELLTVSLPMLLTSFMFTMMSWADTLFLGYYCREAEVGIYNVVKKISLLIIIPLFPINAMAEKQFARLHVYRDSTALKRLARQITWGNILSAAPIFLTIVLFPLFFINLFGPRFSEGKPALIILATAQLITAAFGSVLNLLNMAGQERVVSRIVTGATIASLCLNAWLIPLLGMNGAALAGLLSTLAWGLAGLYCVKKYHGFWMIPRL